MQIGIPLETVEFECRVAATPKTVGQLIKLGFDLQVEGDAGLKANFPNASYQQAGAQIVSQQAVWDSDILLKVSPPSLEEAARLKDGATLICFVYPAQNPELLELLKGKSVTVLAMDCVPRITRSQSMDALSSMANISGYRAVIEASHQFGRFFTGQITPAGKVSPAKVLVIGAGVAGLAAIGASHSMGAIVRAFDTRPEVKEQVESMGGQFLELDVENDTKSEDGYAKVMSDEYIAAEMALFKEQAADVDIIISTAAIPGKPSPKLITREMVEGMKPGSVIVDLAALGGGNCELTEPGKSTTFNDVCIIGYTDLTSRLPTQSSDLLSNNIFNLVKLLCKNKDGQLDIDFEDVIIRTVTVFKEGELTWPAPPVKVSAAPAQQAKQQSVEQTEEKRQEPSNAKYWFAFIGALLFGWVAYYAPPEFLTQFTVFMLACVAGYHLVWNVTHALHTPLMSVTNAVSGIIIVGALLQVSSDKHLVTILAGIAILVASINIFGGFLVTHRMLKMFKKKD